MVTVLWFSGHPEIIQLIQKTTVRIRVVQTAMQSFQVSTYRHPGGSHDLTLRPPHGSVCLALLLSCFTIGALSLVLPKEFTHV